MATWGTLGYHVAYATSWNNHVDIALRSNYGVRVTPRKTNTE